MPFSIDPTSRTQLYISDNSLSFTAIATSSEEEGNDVLTLGTDFQQFLSEPKRRRSTLMSRRRRSSIRSKISVSGTAKDSTDLQFNNEFSLDLSKRTIDDFKEVNILGIGSYGRVFLVEDIHTKKLYAKKSIKKAKISIDEKLTKTQFNEREILTNIEHPAIVKLFYAFHDVDTINFILEYVPGGEIFFHLRNRSRFTEDEVAFYLAEISQAIHHLHKVGIVYRDLKPENVLLDSKGHVVLTDFGLSSLDEKCHSILGTPQFTAPEVLKGEEYSYPADWWSFGIMMYDMLTGEAPFDGNNRKTIFNKILKEKIRLPYYLSEDAKDLLRKLMNKNPDKRMQIDKDYSILQKHRFFRKINWNDLRSLEPPIIPDTSDLEKAENFDHEYIKEILEKESRIKHLSASMENTITTEDVFKGFSFVASKNYLENHM